ncbi:ABC transporter permease [Rhodobacter sp. SY28-1]|uniref:ABC transporter permease n=1 Tax=Rhodobacter sp. SY28-1 TaxID=2562317 RepID=UPI0010C13EAC|nr:ABC transporter permease [Rhodobacter sp. SY28-1]
MTLADDRAAVWDAEERARARAARVEAVARWLVPIAVVFATLGLWQWFVIANEVPHYILPSPVRVWQQLVEDRAILGDALLVTLRITLMALAVAVIGGVLLAIIFDQSRFAELVFYPYAVILQVTPIVSIAPLIFIYVKEPTARVLICAWIVAFFPILSNTTLGLKSTDHNLRDLFSIYGASRVQRLLFLQLPSAMPYFLGGLRIAGGLALIGAIVAEYVVGTGGAGSGLAFRILEASYRLNIPRMFAALALIAVVGVAIFVLTSFVSWLMLRKWHESAMRGGQ